jgi:hypothetical protein
LGYLTFSGSPYLFQAVCGKVVPTLDAVRHLLPFGSL